MTINSMKCAQCGLTQMFQPSCKSCGTPSTASGPTFSPTPTRSKPPLQKKPKPVAPDPLASAPVPEPAVSLKPPSPKKPGMDPGQGNAERHTLSIHGNASTLFGIQIVNLFLTLLTLGVYHFWGKVRVRRYLLSQTEFLDDRFAYHGTGRELLMGFTKAFVVFGVVATLLNIAPLLPGGMGVKFLLIVSAYGLLILFFPVAIVGSRRYKLSRSSWRGIRFSFRGDLKEFIKIFFMGTVMIIFTFGLYRPIFHANQYGFLTSNSYFGGQKFDFDGNGKELFFSYLLSMLLTLPTMGLCWFWFLAKRHRYYWSHTTLGNARFQSAVTGPGLLGLTLTNLLLLLVSIGLAWPWATLRRIRFTFQHLSLNGKIDLNAVQQEAQDVSATGEGLGGLLEIESDFGIA